MGNLLDIHSEKLSLIVKKHGRPVVLIDPVTSEEYPLMALWNDVEHVIKIDSLNGDPMGSRSSLYFCREDLQTLSGEIKPCENWKAFGSPNKYDAEAEYTVRIPKQDKQLPGILLFLEENNAAAQNWAAPGDME